MSRSRSLPVWPENPTLSNYAGAFEPEFRRYFLNSAIVSISTILISVTAGLLAAYSLSRFRVRGFGLVLLFIITAQVAPAATIIIPLFQIVKTFDLLEYLCGARERIRNHHPTGCDLDALGLHQRQPRELEEAAMCDGATRFQAFRLVVVPLARPGIAATAVWLAVVVWQEFLFALSLTTSRNMRTVSVGALATLSDNMNPLRRPNGECGCSIHTGNGVVLLLQRYFVAGLTAGAVKG